MRVLLGHTAQRNAQSEREASSLFFSGPLLSLALLGAGFLGRSNAVQAPPPPLTPPNSNRPARLCGLSPFRSPERLRQLRVSSAEANAGFRHSGSSALQFVSRACISSAQLHQPQCGLRPLRAPRRVFGAIFACFELVASISKQRAPLRSAA